MPSENGEIRDLLGGVSNAPPASERVRVLLPMPMGNGYDYALPEGVTADPGQFVEVPLGPRRLIGVIWPDEADPTVPDKKLKSVLRVLDAPALSLATMEFVDWVARYTLSPRGTVLRLVMRSGQQLTPPKPQTG
ncbi:MAG: primosomal protein N', partial [Pseudomonadota bacterium]